MYSKKFLKFMQIWCQAFGFNRTIDENTSVDVNNDPLPWYTYPAIEYLNQFDFQDKKIFEYGCGNSSLYWNSRAKKVVSVEDKKEWYAQWEKRFQKCSHVIRLRENVNAYAKSLWEENETYDVIVIDGIARAACAAEAIQALSPGGIIIFDDSDRVNRSTEYQKALSILKRAGLLQIDFYGFCPTNIYPKTTSIFFSREFNFPLLHRFQPANGMGNLWALSRKKRKALYKMQLDLENQKEDTCAPVREKFAQVKNENK